MAIGVPVPAADLETKPRVGVPVEVDQTPVVDLGKLAPSGGRAVGVLAEELPLPGQIREMFVKRAAHRRTLALSMRALGSAGKEKDLTPYDESVIEEQVNKTSPLPQVRFKNGWDMRELEVRWGRSRSQYDSKTGYEESVSVPEKAAYAIASGINTGLVGIENSLAWLALHMEAPNVMTIPEIAKAVGHPEWQVEAAYENLKNFSKAQADLVPSQGLIYTDPNTGRNRQHWGYRALEVLGEMTPTLLAATMAGQWAGLVVRAQSAAIGATQLEALAAGASAAHKTSAISYALLGMNAKREYIKEELKQQGYSEQAQTWISDFLAAVTLPADIKLNMSFNPASLYLKGASPLRTVRGQMMMGAVQNAVQSGSSQALTEAGLFATQVKPLTRENLKQSFHTALTAGVEGGVIGGATGMAIKGFEWVHNLQPRVKGNQVVDQMASVIKETMGLDLDVYTKKELYRVWRKEFNLSVNQARETTEMWDRLFQVAMERQGLPKDAGWAVIHARISERLEAVARKEGKLLYSADMSEVPELFDQMKQWMIEKLPKKGKQPAGEILKAIQQSGLRADSYKFSGVEQMLMEASDAGVSLSREEMLSFLDANQVKVEWVHHQDTPPEELRLKGQELFKKMEDAELEAEKIFTKWYKETDPAKKDTLTDQMRQADKARDHAQKVYRTFLESDEGQTTRYSDIRPSGPSTDYGEVVLRWVQPQENVSGGMELSDEAGNPITSEKVKFSTNHWAEKNPVLHLRYDVRTDPKTGERYLVGLEFQSDWHEEGAESGYTEVSPEERSNKILELIDKAEALRKQQGANSKEAQALEDEANQLATAVPPAPFSKTWQELAVKKLILLALDKGIDRIAIMPNFMQDKFQGSVEPGRAQSYDVKLPGHLWRLVKRFDPEAKLESVNMETTENGAIWKDRRSESPKVVVELPHSIRLSDQFKQAFRGDGGYSLFQRRFDDHGEYPLPLKINQKEEGADLFEPPFQGEYRLSPEDAAQKIMSITGLRKVTLSLGGNLVELGHRYDDILQRAGLRPIAEGSFPQDWGAGVRDYLGDDVIVRAWYTEGSEDSAPGANVEVWKRTEPMERSGVAWFQETGTKIRASTNLLDNGRLFVQGLLNPDYGSAIHETAHVMRLALLKGEDLKTVERVMGIGDEGWTRQNEEKFVRWVEEALWNGYSPDPQLQEVFNLMSKSLKKSYPQLDPSQQESMNPEFRHAILRLFKIETEPEKMLKLRIEQLARDVTTMFEQGAELDKTVAENAAAGKTDIELLTDRAELKFHYDHRLKLLVEAQKELVNLEQSAFRDGTETERAKLKAQMDEYWAAENRLDPVQYRNAHWKWLDRWANRLLTPLVPLRTSPFGRQLIDSMANATWFAKSFIGKVSEVRQQALRGLRPVRDKLWAQEYQVFDERQGFTNFQLLTEDPDRPMPFKIQGEVPETMQAYRTARQVISDEGVKQAIGLEMLRQMPRFKKKGTGESIPIRESFRDYFARMYTQDAVMLVLGSEAERIALAESLAKHKGNPGAKEIEKMFERDLDRMIGRGKYRTRGGLEASRLIEIMPDKWRLSDGRWVNLFHNEPVAAMDILINGTAFRLGTVKYFGASVLRNYYKDPKAMGALLGAFGQKSALLDTGQARARLAELGLFPEEQIFGDKEKGIKPMSLGQARKSLEALGLPIGWNAEEMWAQVMTLTADQLPTGRDERNKAITRIKKIARIVGGIDTKKPIETVLSNLKTRLSADIVDDGFQELLRQHIKFEAETDRPSTEKLFTEAWMAFQGYPAPGQIRGTPALEWTQAALSPIYAGMTSLAAWSNLWQVPANVIPLVGLKPVMKALALMMRDPVLAKQMGMRSGAFEDAIRNWGAEETSIPLKIATATRGFGGMVTGQDLMTEVNNVWTSVAGSFVAEDIRLSTQKGKLSRWHRDFLDMMGFEQRDIERIRGGGMEAGDRSRIMQALVERTQYVTAPKHMKALAERSPVVGKLILPFQSFTYGYFRQIDSTIQLLRSDFKKGPGQFATSRGWPMLMGLIAMSAGTGMLIDAGLGWFKGSPPRPEDEDWWQRVADGLFRSGITRMTGIVTNPLQFNTTGPEAVVGSSGLLDILGDVAQLGIDAYQRNLGTSGVSGQYARFGFMRQAYEMWKARTPLVRGLLHRMELKENPFLADYEMTRSWTGSWKRKNVPRETAPMFGPISSDYEPIWFALQRGRMDRAQQALEELYEARLKEADQTGIEFDEDQFFADVRASLKSRRPINLKADEDPAKDQLGPFLKTLSPENRDKLLWTDKKYMDMVDTLTGG